MNKIQKWCSNNLKIITSEPKAIWKSKTILGEGTLWVPSQNSIYFVDIKKKNILVLNTKSKKKKIIKVDREIGFITHVKENIFILGTYGNDTWATTDSCTCIFGNDTIVTIDSNVFLAKFDSSFQFEWVRNFVSIMDANKDCFSNFTISI